MNLILQKRLKELRKEMKYSQVDVASWFGLDSSTVSAWENGKNMPDADKLVILSRKFNCSVDYLLGESNKKSPADKGEAVSIHGYGRLSNEEIMKAVLAASQQAALAVLKELDKKD